MSDIQRVTDRFEQSTMQLYARAYLLKEVLQQEEKLQKVLSVCKDVREESVLRSSVDRVHQHTD